MTEQKLNEITNNVADIYRNSEFYDCIDCEHKDFENCIDCDKKGTIYRLLDIIASLHNELYKEVTGKYYDYMFHWANHGYGGSPNDSMFKEEEE
jgi:hypothetical protein